MTSSSATSTATASSLSRAESLSTMDYLQGGSHRSHYSRGSTATGSTTGSSFGQSVTSRSGSGGSIGHSLQHHQSMGSIGRANLNAALHQQQRRPPHESTTGSALSNMAAPKSGSDGAAAGSAKSGPSSTGGSVGTEQGRNSTKRAAQNRAAQRAFRQRKDLYVRELERKAEMWHRAEGTIMRLEQRNRELEQALAFANQQKQANQPSSPLSPTPQHSPRAKHVQLSPTAGGQTAASSSAASERGRHDWDLMDRDRAEDRCHATKHTTLGRHASSHQLYHAYNSDSLSPKLTNGSLKQLSHTHRQQPSHTQHPQRPESDYEGDSHERHAGHRHLHRHPSEPSLSMVVRRGSNSADPDDYFGSAGRLSHRAQHYHHLGDMATVRSGSIDSSGLDLSQHSSNQYSPHAHPEHPIQQPLHERPPIPQAPTPGARGAPSATLPGGHPNPVLTKPWPSSTLSKEENMKTQALLTPLGGMVTAASPPSKIYSGAEMEYMTDEPRSKAESPYEMGNVKMPTDSAIREWAEQRGPIHSSTPHSPVSLPPVSCLTTPTASGDMEMQESMPQHHTQQQHPPQHHQHQHLQHRGSASSLSGRDGSDRRPSGSETSGGGGGHSRTMTTESPDMSSISTDSRFNNNHNNSNSHSTNASPTAGSAITQAQQAVTRHQKLYFSSLKQQHQQLALVQAQQQQQRVGVLPHLMQHRHSPENDHPLAAIGSYQQHRIVGHHHEHVVSGGGDKYARGLHHDPSGAEMDSLYEQQQQHHHHRQQPVRTSAGYHNEAAMRSP
ncbi:hypothetical protein BGX28_010106 [Mortierella sp. GBA30]|nr:hypothetical protein BGX28_010106 [Mortierella sp. GBA30]